MIKVTDKRIAHNKWTFVEKYKILGGFNYKYIGDNEDIAIISTCSTISTKYIIDGKESYLSIRNAHLLNHILFSIKIT